MGHIERLYESSHAMLRRVLAGRRAAVGLGGNANTRKRCASEK